jgi:hypothetical protein
LCVKACAAQHDESSEKTAWVYGRDSDEETPYIYLIGRKLVTPALATLNKNAFEAVGESSQTLFEFGSKALGLLPDKG